MNLVRLAVRADPLSPTTHYQTGLFSIHRGDLEKAIDVCQNGIKHHPRLDGKITISVREQEYGYEFTVADDGAGIAPMAQKRVFDIFNTLNKNKSNTGVGLAIVKKIVEERGGKITLESKVRKGSSFCFQWIK